MKSSATHTALFALLLSLLAAAPAHATPIVVATVAPAGALFHYDYSITFDPPDEEILFLTIVLLPGDSLVGLTAPDGYVASYDSGLGFLDLFPDVGFIFPDDGTLSGFAFFSAHAEGATTFDALTFFGSLSGDTTGPVGDATSVIPEPVTGVLMTIGLGAVGGRRAIRRRNRSRG